MGKVKTAPRLHSTQIGGTFTEENKKQSEKLIAIRLRTATNLAVDQAASIAWVERRIIRDRMRYYTSAYDKVIN